MIYVLEGLKDYMVSRQWQAGDIGKQSNSLWKNLTGLCHLIFHVFNGIATRGVSWSCLYLFRSTFFPFQPVGP